MLLGRSQQTRDWPARWSTGILTTGKTSARRESPPKLLSRVTKASPYFSVACDL